MKLFLQIVLGAASTISIFLLLGLSIYGAIAIAVGCVVSIVAALKSHDERAPFWIWISYCVFFGLMLGATWPAIPMWLLSGPNKIQGPGKPSDSESP